MFTILVIEDNDELRNLYSLALRKQGYETLSASDGVTASQLLEQNFVDMVITDIMMPNMNGYEFVKYLRSFNKEIPIIIITARDDFSSKQEGYHLGTDDYMVKPIDVNELCLRVEALLRRSKIVHERKQTIGETVLDLDALSVTRNDLSYDLSKKEFYLLYKLISTPNKIHTRQQLMDEIWGVEAESDARTVDVHISKLRKLFEANPDFSIKTIRGLGYKVTIPDHMR